MRAAFSDPEGPRTWRTAPYAVALALLLLAIFAPIGGRAAFGLGVASFTLFHLIGVLGMLFRQRTPRAAELECGPGFVEITRSGTRNQRIHARHITGATTARTPDGVSLTLQHAKRSIPLTITVPKEEDAEKIRQALGIGHGGFGKLSWPTRGNPLGKTAFVGRAIAASLGLLVQLAVAFSEDWAVPALLLGQFAFLAALVGLAGFPARREPTVVMGADGLWLMTTQGPYTVPYSYVLDVTVVPGGLSFSVPPPHHTLFVPRDSITFLGTSAADCEILAAQVIAAAQRARGLGPQKEEVAGRVEILRRNGESPREWLMRLDMAGQMLSAGHGYRGQALDPQDLWAILEDPEADAELRAAAARVLRHSNAPETRTRIATAVAAVRDEDTHRRLRIAIEDDAPDEVQLADLAELDPRARARQHLPRSPY